MTGGMDVPVIGRSFEARRMTGFLTPSLFKSKSKKNLFLTSFVWSLAFPSKSECMLSVDACVPCLGVPVQICKVAN